MAVLPMSEQGQSPLVSVVLCTYNDEAYLAEAMDSIFAQSYAHFEFIVVNDGSTDRTKEIVLGYDSEKIRYIENEVNLGLEKSKNIGLRAAKGKYIAYMDGDDISVPERLALQVDLLEHHPEVGVCGGWIEYFGNRKGTNKVPESDLDIRLLALFSSPIPHPTFILRRQVLLDHNLRYELGFKAAEDYDFILLLLRHTQARNVQQVLLNYRWHERNISVEQSSVQRESSTRVSQVAMQQLLGIELEEEEIALVFQFLFGPGSLQDARKTYQFLNPKLRASKGELVKPFQRWHAETSMRLFARESRQGWPALSSFWYTKPWRFLSFKRFFWQYLLLVGRSIYRSIVRS